MEGKLPPLEGKLPRSEGEPPRQVAKIAEPLTPEQVAPACRGQRPPSGPFPCYTAASLVHCLLWETGTRPRVPTLNRAPAAASLVVHYLLLKIGV